MRFAIRYRDACVLHISGHFSFPYCIRAKFAELRFLRYWVNGAQRKGRGFYTRAGPNRGTPLQASWSSPPSSPAGLANPFAGPFDFLTLLCDVVPRVGSDPIRSRATEDEVLAPIHRTDIVVATPTVAIVRAAAKVQAVGAAPSIDAVSATVAVNSVTIRGAYKVVGLLLPLIVPLIEAGERRA